MYRLVSGNSRVVKKALSPLLSANRYASYNLPSIPHLDSLRYSKEDFHGVYTNKAINELWFKRGQQLTDGLNQLLEENGINDPPADLNALITLTFNKPELYGVYSYASLLHNLQFTLESLKPLDESTSSNKIRKCHPNDLLRTPNAYEKINNEPLSPELRNWIDESFGSIEEFKTLFLNSAKAIKGDGLTWLVARAVRRDTDSSPNQEYDELAVMNTYNAGIVDDALRSGQITKLKEEKKYKLAALKKKHEERQKIKEENGEIDSENIEEFNNELNASFESKSSIPSNLILGTVEEAEALNSFSKRKLLPILAIDASSRNYLIDYGVFGKQQYLDNVWDAIDWNVVAQRLPSKFKATVQL